MRKKKRVVSEETRQKMREAYQRRMNKTEAQEEIEQINSDGIIGIIQCRTGSKRLPGKALLPLAGKPMIYRFIERVKQSELLSDIVLATTEKPEDDILIGIAKELGIKTFRGSENDLIERLLMCAKQYNAKAVVRLCADNPLIEGSEIDRIITLYKNKQSQGILYSNTHNIFNNMYPDGLGAEVYRIGDLEWLSRSVTSPKYREHPHTYFFDYNLVETVRCPKELSYPRLKLDVNTQAEYEYIKGIYDKFGHNNFKATDYIGGLK